MEALRAAYDSQGKMISVQWITESGGSADVTGGDLARVFWLNAGNGAPKADRVEFDLAAR